MGRRGPNSGPRNKAPTSHPSLRPQSSPTCNCSLRSLHPSLAASRGLTAIGLHRCPASSPPSVSGATTQLKASGPSPEASLRVTSQAAAERRGGPPSPPRRFLPVCAAGRGRGGRAPGEPGVRGVRDAPPPAQAPGRRGWGTLASAPSDPRWPRGSFLVYGFTCQAVLLGAVNGGRALGLFLRHLAAEPSRVAAGGAVDPARREGAHWPVRLCPGR